MELLVKQDPTPKPRWVAGGAIFLDVAGYNVMLVEDTDVPDIKAYSGNLDFGSQPVSIKAIAHRLWAEAFDLELPDSIPDIRFNSLGGTIQCAPSKEYTFHAASEINLPNPFGLESQSIDFMNLLLALHYIEPLQDSKQPAKRLITISADINYHPGGSGTGTISFGKVMFIFSSGVYVFGLTINQSVSPAELLERALGMHLPPVIGDFFRGIEFGPEGISKPIRLYNANKNYTYELTDEGKIKQVIYKQGFHLDQLNLQLFDEYNFLVALSITDDTPPSKKKIFSLSAYTPAFDLLGLGLLVITHKKNDPHTSYGMQLEVNTATSTVALHGGIIFFPDPGSTDPKKNIALDFDLAYSSADKTDPQFTGDVTYQGITAGQTNPTLGFAWSKVNGFRLTKFPFDVSQLEALMNWADQLKRLANSLEGCEKSCEKITDLVLDQVLTTKFTFNFKPQSAGKTGYVGLKASGTYSISVLDKKVSDIVFTPLNFEFKIPSGFDDLGNAILDSLKANVDAIATGLWNNRAQLTELLAYVTIKEASQAAVCRLTCKVGEEALKNALKSVATEAAKKAGEFLMETLAQAVATVVAATGLINAILAFFKWLFRLSDDQESEKANAEKKRKLALDRIKEKLAIAKVTVEYKERTDNEDKKINVKWDDVPAEKPPEKGTVYFTLSFIRRSDGAHMFSPIRLDRSVTSYTIPDTAFAAGTEYKVSILGCYDVDGATYTGDPTEKLIATPILASPIVTCSFDWISEQSRKSGSFSVNWNKPPNAGSVYPTGYVVKMRHIRSNTVIQTHTMNDSNMTFLTIKLYDDTVSPGDRFFPKPDEDYEIAVIANASDPDLNSVAGKSDPFKILWGVYYMRVGYNFKIS